MNTAVFVSGGGTNLQVLIDLKSASGLPACDIVRVVASRSGTRAEERAKSRGIPVSVVSRRDFSSQEEYDAALISLLEPLDIGLVVLAGFLTKLGPQFVSRYGQRILNVHPSLLPSFGGPGFYGLKPHEAVLERGCRVSGATVHFVDETYDNGPILLQKAVDVRQGDTPELLQLRVMLEAEHKILPQAVDLFTRGLVRFKENGHCVILDEEGVLTE